MYTALIVAAGSGKRTRLPFNKMFYEIKGKPMVMYSLERFIADSDCEEVIVVHSAVDATKMATLMKPYPAVKLVVGGETRQQSVYAGLKVAKGRFVFIHDGARPNLKRPNIEDLKKAVKESDAATLAVPLRDTMATMENNYLTDYVPREKTYALQTPQAFRTESILKAHNLANNSGKDYTDDTTIYLDTFQNNNVKIVLGDEDNIKVTTKTDLLLMEVLL
jgi:2-C-methyl-D-erythritol 4-phosphate cytidylyltransferase